MEKNDWPESAGCAWDTPKIGEGGGDAWDDIRRALKDRRNKGFTLVELIVVIVILAILAAILVPALLGYIDRAKNSQYILNAKNVMTAAQAELAEVYATGELAECGTSFDHDKFGENIAETADVDAEEYIFVIWVNKDDYTSHDSYTIKGFAYIQGKDFTDQEKDGVEGAVFYDGESWSEEEESIDGYRFQSYWMKKNSGTWDCESTANYMGMDKGVWDW